MLSHLVQAKQIVFDEDLNNIFFISGPESFKIFGEKMPDFPLVPASRGFCLSLDSSLEKFKTALKASNLLWLQLLLLFERKTIIQLGILISIKGIKF